MPEFGVADEKGQILMGPVDCSYTQASDAMIVIGENLDDLLDGRKVLGRNVERAIAAMPEHWWIRRNLVKAVELARERKDHEVRFFVLGIES